MRRNYVTIGILVALIAALLCREQDKRYPRLRHFDRHNLCNGTRTTADRADFHNNDSSCAISVRITSRSKSETKHLLRTFPGMRTSSLSCAHSPPRPHLRSPGKSIPRSGSSLNPSTEKERQRILLDTLCERKIVRHRRFKRNRPCRRYRRVAL